MEGNPHRKCISPIGSTRKCSTYLPRLHYPERASLGTITPSKSVPLAFLHMNLTLVSTMVLPSPSEAHTASSSYEAYWRPVCLCAMSSQLPLLTLFSLFPPFSLYLYPKTMDLAKPPVCAYRRHLGLGSTITLAEFWTTNSTVVCVLRAHLVLTEKQVSKFRTP